MANLLTIAKDVGGYFKFTITENDVVKPTIRNMRNDAIAKDNLINIKTANGANLILIQNIKVSDITIIADGTFTFTDIDLFFRKLIEIGYWTWAGISGGGTGGVNRFELLEDTFTYFGRDGLAVRVNESQQKLETFQVYNYRNITDLEDVYNTALPNKMLSTDNDGNVILRELPTENEQFLNAVGSFHYADLATQTTPLNFLSNTALKLTNDTLGTYTNLVNAPYGVTSVWNNVTNQLDFTQLSKGDVLTIRIDATVTTGSANQQIKGFVKFGIGSVKEFDLVLDQEVIKTAGVHSFVPEVNFDLAYDEIVNNPAEIFFVSDGNGDIVINGWYIQILRKNINIVNLRSKNLYVTTETGIAKTLSPIDECIIFTSPDPVIFTIPNNDTVEIPIGTQVQYTQEGDGVVTLDGTGITFISNLNIATVKGETRELTKIATDTWSVEGSVSLPDPSPITLELTTSLFSKGIGAGVNAANAVNSIFLGVSAGQNATDAAQSIFLGNSAGTNAINAYDSNFLGLGAGYYAENASYSNFLGNTAGIQATNASYSNFFGFRTGAAFFGNNVGSNNIIIGTNISLPDAAANRINLGGVLFGFNTNSDATDDPKIVAMSDGRVAIGSNTDDGVNRLQVNGTVSADAATEPNQVVVKSQLDAAVSSASSGSGTYTPTITGLSNISSSSLSSATYTKIGNIINVTIAYNVNPTASSVNSEIKVTLPINRSVITLQYVGVSAINNASAGGSVSGIIYTNTNINEAIIYFKPLATGTHIGIANFQYNIN